jgi:hypothetical protein
LAPIPAAAPTPSPAAANFTVFVLSDAAVAAVHPLRTERSFPELPLLGRLSRVEAVYHWLPWYLAHILFLAGFLFGSGE